jgi:hypothetical protein
LGEILSALPKGSGKHHGTHPSAESEAVRNVIQVI